MLLPAPIPLTKPRRAAEVMRQAGLTVDATGGSAPAAVSTPTQQVIHNHIYLDGTEIDYVEGLHGAGFKFQNPNSKGSCGCGKSQSY